VDKSSPTPPAPSPIASSLSGLLGLFDHFDSKKLAATIKGIVGEFAVLAISIANTRWSLGIPDSVIQSAAIGIAGMVTANVLGQSYVDGKTQGATSGIEAKK
jgi:hypothetical protein